MKVSGVGSGKGADRTRKKERTSSGGFADELRDVAGAHGAVSSVDGIAPTAGVSGILAVQEVADATTGEARKKARRYGDDLLDRLDEIRAGLLTGAIPKDDLLTLAQKVRAGRAKIDDPKLSAVLDEIELRCEVEIAKLTRSF